MLRWITFQKSEDLIMSFNNKVKIWERQMLKKR